MNGGNSKSSMPSSTLSLTIVGQSSLVARVAPPRLPMLFGQPESVVGKPMTKSYNVKQVGEDIFELLCEFKTMQSEKSMDASNKREDAHRVKGEA